MWITKGISGKEDHFVARGVYDFEPENSDELRFKVGDTLIVAPKERQPNIRFTSFILWIRNLMLIQNIH